jgi:hypothetical protein
MRVASSGNVGIGVGSPLGRLHINQTDGSPSLLLANSTSSTPYMQFQSGGFIQDLTGTTISFVASGAGGYLRFATGGNIERWRMNENGHMLAGTDNSFDIGASGASRPRNIFVGNNVTVAAQMIVGASALSASNNYGTPQAGASSDAYSTFHVESHNNQAGNYSFIGLMRSRGTRAAPTHNQSGDTLGGLTAQVLQDAASSFPYRAGAQISFVAEGNHTTTSLPTYISFLTVAASSVNTAEQMRLTASGNLGLGVIPSAWSVRALQIGATTAVWQESASAFLSANVYFDGSNRYISTAAASRYEQNAGSHRWFSAASGTAGNAITFTQAMTLFASGSLTLGGTNDSARLRVEGSTNLTTALQLFRAGNTCGAIWQENGAMRFGVNGSDGFNERWSINNSGHFLAGTDNSFDIGASGATRPRTVYAATSVEGGYIRAGAASAGAASTTTIGNGTATTVGAAGAASALPANPLGYIIAHVGTTQVKIPYYNN